MGYPYFTLFEMFRLFTPTQNLTTAKAAILNGSASDVNDAWPKSRLSSLGSLHSVLPICTDLLHEGQREPIVRQDPYLSFGTNL